jgi:hypothetical protein
MTGEWNQQLPVQTDDRAQVWIIGSREQVNHMMNEFYVRRLATDFLRKHFVSASNSPPSFPPPSLTANT